MRHKVSKYIANVWQGRELAGYLSMVYTVYKGVRLGLSAESADFHDTPQGVHHKFSCIRPVFFTDPHFEG